MPTKKGTPFFFADTSLPNHEKERRTLLRSPFLVVGNQRGIAILVTLFSIMLMTFLAYEIGYSTAVELRVGQGQLDRLRASYLAKSGVQVSLLRIHLYRYAMNKFASQLGPNKSMLDVIWNFPFVWPPKAPPGVGEFDKNAIDRIVKESYIEGTFGAQIEGEGGKIDINDLGSPAERLRLSTKQQLVQLLENRLLEDDEWAKENRGMRVEELVNNIADWVSSGTTSLNGGDKFSYYSGLEPRYYPPLRAMKTLEELHMVKGVTDEIFNILAPRVSVYGVKGINVNTASKEVIQSIDKSFTDEVVNAIIERRQDSQKGGPFNDINDFKNFIQTYVNIENFNKNPEIPLIFDSEFNFRIKSVGNYKRATREIVAIVYDFDKVKGQLVSLLPTPTPGGTPGGSPTPPGGTPGGGTPTPPGGSPPAGSTNAPRIVYWRES